MEQELPPTGKLSDKRILTVQSSFFVNSNVEPPSGRTPKLSIFHGILSSDLNDSNTSNLLSSSQSDFKDALDVTVLNQKERHLIDLSDFAQPVVTQSQTVLPDVTKDFECLLDSRVNDFLLSYFLPLLLEFYVAKLQLVL